jgi:AraC-like DNA-binding protein
MNAIHAHFNWRDHSLPLPIERMLDDLPGLVFFIKDRDGRYLWVNRTLVERSGRHERAEVIGCRPSDLFPEALARFYERQDERVLQTGKPLSNVLELHLYAKRRRGWCLTNKYPVPHPDGGGCAGVLGVSRDVEPSARGAADRGFPELAKALELVQRRIADPPRLSELAGSCGLSAGRFSELVGRLFDLTPKQLVLKARVDEALHLLSTTALPLSEVALATGFCDQSAFTRHFRKLTGTTPGAFRER